MNTLTFPQLVEWYLHSLEKKPCYRRTLSLAKPWILTLKECPTRKDVLARHARVDLDGHPTTGDYQDLAAVANKEITLLSTLIRAGLYRELWDGPNPADRIRMWKMPDRIETLNEQDIAALLTYFEAADTLRERVDRAIFGLLLCTGCRPSEARLAKKADLRHYGRMGILTKHKTKTNRKQEVPVPAQLMTWISTLPSTDSEFLFSNADGGPWSEDFLRDRWHAIRTDLGLAHLWTYDFRRSLATHLPAVQHVPDSMVKAILNHKTGTTQDHYTHYRIDSLCPIIQAYADWMWSLKQSPYPGVESAMPMRTSLISREQLVSIS